MTLLYTLTGATEKQKEKKKFSLWKCIQKSDVVIKIIWVLVLGIMYLVLVYPMTRSLKTHIEAGHNGDKVLDFEWCGLIF